MKLNKGFTLVELLMVIVIIGVLSTIGFAYINPLKQFQKAHDTQRKSDLAQIQAALELYRSDNKAYPDTISCGGSLTSTLTSTTYLKSVPCDPTTHGAYYYESDTSTYTVCACLENEDDSGPGISDGDCSSSLPCSSNKYTVTNP